MWSAYLVAMSSANFAPARWHYYSMTKGWWLLILAARSAPTIFIIMILSIIIADMQRAMIAQRTESWGAGKAGAHRLAQTCAAPSAARSRRSTSQK
jgi:hypothetical protein